MGMVWCAAKYYESIHIYRLSIVYVFAMYRLCSMYALRMFYVCSAYHK